MNSIKSYFKIFKKKIFNIKNFNYVLILSLISSSIILALTFIYFSLDYTKSIEKSVTNREYIVFDNKSSDILKNNEHIIFYGNDVYNNEPFYEIEKINGYKSGITIKPLLDNKEIHIIDGSNIKNKGELICSKNFYPYFLTKYDDKKIIDGKKLINKNINIDNETFTIVGTFKNIPLETADTCYIGKEDFLKLDLTNGDDTLILIDDISNSKEVTDYLSKNNLEYIKVIENNKMISYIFFYIPIFVMLIIIVIMIDVIYFFIKKKIITRLKLYGVLKSCGYSNKNIIRMNIIENYILLIFIIPISILIYYIFITLIKKELMYEFIYNNLYLNFPIIYYILFLILFVIITNLIIILLSKKYLNSEANLLIGEEEN